MATSLLLFASTRILRLLSATIFLLVSTSTAFPTTPSPGVNHRRRTVFVGGVVGDLDLRQKRRIRRLDTIVLLGMGTTTNSRATAIDRVIPDLLPSESARREFLDKSILITGSSRGLGRSLALAMSSCDPSMLILSGRDETALRRVREECLSRTISIQGRRATKVEIVVCDLADKASVEGLADAALSLAREHRSGGGVDSGCDGIDVLINNGGISSRSSFLETGIDVDERLMQVNFFAGAALAKRLVPSMVDGMSGGKVIWISSIQGKLGTPCRTSYAASKFATQGYCESLRSELASSNVTVHVVSPGYIRTNLSLSAIMGDGKAYTKMDETTANGADPDAVAVDILNSVAAGKSDFVVAATFSAKIAMWLRFMAPSILDRILVIRFEKQRHELKKKD